MLWRLLLYNLVHTIRTDAGFVDQSTKWQLKAINKVGRSAESDVLVLDSTTSFNHACIECGAEVALRDLDSSNKTLLNGEVVVPNIRYPLKVGDVIHFGSSTAFRLTRE